MIAHDNPVFLNYSNHDKQEMERYNFTGFDRVESFYVMYDMLDSPLFLWSHVPGPAEDKITIITED